MLGESVVAHTRASEDTPMRATRFALFSCQRSKSRDLPQEDVANHVRGSFGGDNRDRTGNLRLAKPALSQLSYIPESSFRQSLVRVALERGGPG